MPQFFAPMMSMLCVSLNQFLDKEKRRGVGKRREENDVSLLERCWVPSFSHSSWAVVDHVAGLAAEGVVTTTVGHAC